MIKQYWNFFKIDKCEDRLDASFVTATFCMAQTTCRESCGIQLLAKKTGNHPRICTISIQNEILRSDKTRVLFHTFPISFLLFYLLFIKNTIDTKNVMSNRDYLLLIYTCMCIILFPMIIILSFQSHQIRMLSAEWHGIDTDCPVFI